MSPRKLSRGSWFMIVLSVLLSTSVLVSAYATFSNTVATDQEDFITGTTLALEDVAGDWPNYDAGVNGTHEDDVDYDQGVVISANDYNGSYHIVVRVFLSDLTEFPPSRMNFIIWLSEFQNTTLELAGSGAYVIATTASVNITQGEVHHHTFVVSINTDAAISRMEFSVVADP